MAKILGIGIATVDIVNDVDHYPDEDEELRALSQRKVRGGNVTNSLCVLSQLGQQCDWLGTLADEPDAKIIIDDLDRFHINHENVVKHGKGKVPTSYITFNRHNGSRTIVHYRDLPELQYQDIHSVKFEHYDWIHLEGRNVDQLQKIVRLIRQTYPQIKLSLEIEKNRNDIESLYPYVDLLLFSKNFCREKGFATAEQLFQSLELNITAVCAWGEQGAYAKNAQNEYFHCPTNTITDVVDSVGAGDTFNAAYINAAIEDRSIQECLKFANQIAGKKLQQVGFAGLI